MSQRFVQLAMIVLVLGCRSTPDPAPVSTTASGEVLADESEWVQRPAVIRREGERENVVVPPHASAGVPLYVEFTTYGGGCVREDSTEIQTRGLVAELHPYQRVPPEEARVPCTRELRMTPRRVPVTFMEAGSAKIRIHGLTQPGDSIIVLERSVRIP